MTFVYPYEKMSTKEWMNKNVGYEMLDVPVLYRSRKQKAELNKQNLRAKKRVKKHIGKTKGKVRVVCYTDNFVSIVIFDEVSDIESFKNKLNPILSTKEKL